MADRFSLCGSKLFKNKKTSRRTGEIATIGGLRGMSTMTFLLHKKKYANRYGLNIINESLYLFINCVVMIYKKKVFTVMDETCPINSMCIYIYIYI